MMDLTNIAVRESPRNDEAGVTTLDVVLKEQNLTQTPNTIIVFVYLVSVAVNLTGLWYLFNIKKNNYTIYILSLFMADIIFLIGCAMTAVGVICHYTGIVTSETNIQIALVTGEVLVQLGFKDVSFVLTAISMEMGLSVLFPIWCERRPLTQQSVIVCVILWALSCLVVALENVVCKDEVQYPAHSSEKCTAAYLFTTVLYLVVIFLMLFSSLALLNEMQKTVKQRHPVGLYFVAVMIVYIFQLSVLPTRVLGLLIDYGILPAKIFLIDYFL